VDIIITINDFRTLANVGITDSTRTNLMQNASTTITHVATNATQNKT
jgi:hypothetical protein